MLGVASSRIALTSSSVTSGLRSSRSRAIAPQSAPKSSEIAVELGDRHAEVENEQRDRDRKHTVAERLDPPGLPATAHGDDFAARRS